MSHHTSHYRHTICESCFAPGQYEVFRFNNAMLCAKCRDIEARHKKNCTAESRTALLQARAARRATTRKLDTTITSNRALPWKVWGEVYA